MHPRVSVHIIIRGMSTAVRRRKCFRWRKKEFGTAGNKRSVKTLPVDFREPPLVYVQRNHVSLFS